MIQNFYTQNREGILIILLVIISIASWLILNRFYWKIKESKSWIKKIKEVDFDFNKFNEEEFGSRIQRKK